MIPMNWKTTVGVALTSLAITGCESLPGTRGQQGAVIGGASGAAVGAAVGGSEHRALGAILGGLLGAGGGYVIGANQERVNNRDEEAAQQSAQRSQQQPATAQQAMNATTADINNDGFVTLDEVVAMKSAGLSDDRMIERLRMTNQVFELTQEQRRYLRDRGVSDWVVGQMEQLNRGARSSSSTPGSSVITTPNR